MKYGLIGYPLEHSFSAQIHPLLSGEAYALKELAAEELEAFFCAREFAAVNVTIPYKSAVIPYLDEVDAVAERIGAVNAIVNQNGTLVGYNTDYCGLKALIERNGVCLKGKTVLILGSGGTSLTAKVLAQDEGAKEVLRVSRGTKPDCITYEQARHHYSHAQVIVNTTPVGMYPHVHEKVLSLEPFTKLEAVFDAVYNPLRTDLVLEAQQRGITAEGGLYMLVAQAVFAGEKFYGKVFDSQVTDALFRRELAKRQNIVLTGMPGSGKTTVGKALAKSLVRTFADTDAIIEARAGKTVSEIFKQSGEAVFREMESTVIEELSTQASGLVIATGGGAVIKEENVSNLKHNGKLYFLNRSIDSIVPTADRPLALDRQALEERLRERYAIYCCTADKRIEVQSDALSIAQIIGKDYSIES